MGNTSIKYLQTNVFDCIKLDSSLSRNVLSNPRSLEIVASIAELAASFGIRVLAEFVETSQQREILEGAGCRRIRATCTAQLYRWTACGRRCPVQNRPTRVCGTGCRRTAR
ncbi:MAG: EAL domain-containing protein [Oscillospiraceae bacterium]